jgi:hypothetical protein
MEAEEDTNMNNAILDVEQVEHIRYESGCLTIQTDHGSVEAVFHRGMTVETAIAALRRIASQLELGAKERNHASTHASVRAQQ